jgi:hypothetical protein
MRELRDDRHAEKRRMLLLSRNSSLSKASAQGERGTAKQNDSKSSRAAMHGWRSSRGRGRKMTERERERERERGE